MRWGWRKLLGDSARRHEQVMVDALFPPQRVDTATMRSMLDNAVLASMPSAFRAGDTIKFHATHINSQEDTMAKRKAKAKRPRRKRELSNDEKYWASRQAAGAYDDVPPSTAAERLHADQPAKPSDAETAMLLIVPFALTGLGFSYEEVASIFGITTGDATERAHSGAMIADRLGISGTVRSMAQRSRLLRENQWAEGARIAAKAMQERIVDAIPAFIRLAETGKVGDAYGIAAVVRMVQAFSPDDVVQVSKAARDLRDQPQDGAIRTAGAVLAGVGTVSAIQANRPPTGTSPIPSSADIRAKESAAYRGRFAEERDRPTVKPYREY